MKYKNKTKKKASIYMYMKQEGVSRKAVILQLSICVCSDGWALVLLVIRGICIFLTGVFFLVARRHICVRSVKAVAVAGLSV